CETACRGSARRLRPPAAGGRGPRRRADPALRDGRARGAGLGARPPGRAARALSSGMERWRPPAPRDHATPAQGPSGGGPDADGPAVRATVLVFVFLLCLYALSGGGQGYSGGGTLSYEAAPQNAT